MLHFVVLLYAHTFLALPYNGELASPVSSRGGTSADPVAAMWHDVTSLIANKRSKVNEKIVGICQKLSLLETKLQALEAEKGTCVSTDPEEQKKYLCRCVM